MEKMIGILLLGFFLALLLFLLIFFMGNGALNRYFESSMYRRNVSKETIATVYKGNIIKNLIMDCQSYTKYRPNETTGGIFVSWRRKEELPTGA